MKKMAFAAMAVAAVAFVSGNVAAQDTGASAGGTASAPASTPPDTGASAGGGASAPEATMQPIPNPPESGSASHGAMHGKHHAKHHAMKKGGHSKSSAGAAGSDMAATPAPQ